MSLSADAPDGREAAGTGADRSPHFATPPSPHIRSETTSRRIMVDVLIALTPAVLGSIYLFGARVVPYYLVSVATALGLDWLCRRLRREETPFDVTAIVTAVLLAMSLPAGVPLWFPALGAVVAILLAKELFGGTGRNFLNPAVTGRLVLRLLFVGEMTRNIWPRQAILQPPPGLDALSGTTPLMVLKRGFDLDNEALLASFFGNVGGKIGETSALLLLVGAGYLLVRRVISPRIPFTLIGTIALIAWIWGGDGFLSGDWRMALGHVLGGATMLAAFFMATDYASSPSTPLGQSIFAVGVGVITMLIRFYSGYSEGLTFAIFFMNLSVPFLNRVTMPRVLGTGKG